MKKKPKKIDWACEQADTSSIIFNQFMTGACVGCLAIVHQASRDEIEQSIRKAGRK